MPVFRFGLPLLCAAAVPLLCCCCLVSPLVETGLAGLRGKDVLPFELVAIWGLCWGNFRILPQTHPETINDSIEFRIPQAQPPSSNRHRNAGGGAPSRRAPRRLRRPRPRRLRADRGGGAAAVQGGGGARRGGHGVDFWCSVQFGKWKDLYKIDQVTTYSLQKERYKFWAGG